MALRFHHLLAVQPKLHTRKRMDAVVNAPVIRLADTDYALWYRDIMEDPKKYDGKTVSFRGIVAVDPKFPPNTFAVGRHVMTCCVEDIQFCSFKTDKWFIDVSILSWIYGFV